MQTLLEYAVPALYPFKFNHINLLENVQDRFTRACFLYTRDVTYKDRLTILQLPPIVNRYKYLLLVFDLNGQR